MPIFSRNKKHSKAQFPTNSQSQSPQSQSVYPWSAHATTLGLSPSPFPRHGHTLSTSATAAGDLFLFGGYIPSSGSPSNDLYVISTLDFSATLLQTSGDVPSPRHSHSAVLTGTSLLIWGGSADFSQNVQNLTNDDSFYLLDLVSREWSRIVVDGFGPGARYYHTMTLVGSKLFVFGGSQRSDNTHNRQLNDIWAMDLNCLSSNPSWESYEPAPGNEKPHRRFGHVSVTTGDRIIIFGGYNSERLLNDSWSFDISTRKWTELQCTGPVPSPRVSHAAVLIDDVLYVYGGKTVDEPNGGDLTALNLSTQRWTAFNDIGPSPCGRAGHAMASDGRRVFVLGGYLSRGAQVGEAKLIHVLDTKHPRYPLPDSDAVNPNKKTTQLVRESPEKPPTRRQPHQPSSSSDAHAAHGATPSRKATPEELGRSTSQQISREQNVSLNRLSSRPTGASGSPRRVPTKDDDDEGSAEHNAKLVAPDPPSVKEIAQLEGRLIELERQLSEMVVAQIERDRLIAQLTDKLEQATEEKKRAGPVLRELQVKLDEVEAEEKERAGLLRELQARFVPPGVSSEAWEKNSHDPVEPVPTRLLSSKVQAEAASSYPKLEGGTYYITGAGKCVVLDNNFQVRMDANTGNDKERWIVETYNWEGGTYTIRNKAFARTTFAGVKAQNRAPVVGQANHVEWEIKAVNHQQYRILLSGRAWSANEDNKVQLADIDTSANNQLWEFKRRF